MKRSVELVATYWSMVGDCYPGGPSEVSPVDFRDRVEMAGKVGYRGIGFALPDLLSVSNRIGYDTMKRVLDDNGMRHVEVEIIMDWFADGEKRARSDIIRGQLLHAAEQLGARHIKIGGDFDNDGQNEWPMDLMIREFAALCGDAAGVGTGIALELMPFSNLSTIDQGLELVSGAGAGNGGLLIDIWHMARGGIDYEQISRMPKSAISWIELNDARAEIEGTLFNDTVHCRVLPGEGAFDVQSFLKAVLATGYDGPYGVEILSRTHRKLPLEEQARRGFDSTMKQFESLE